MSEKKSGMVTEEEEIRRQREAFVAECREKIRNGKRKFSNAERVAARVLKVDLAELIEEEKEEARNQGYACEMAQHHLKDPFVLAVFHAVHHMHRTQ